MIRALWSAATGMVAKQLDIDIIAHNLANINTTGFKKVRAEFQDLVSQTVRVPGAPADGGGMVPVGVQVGLGTRAASTLRIFTQGDFQRTENPFDLAIEGDGFFVVTRWTARRPIRATAPSNSMPRGEWSPATDFHWSRP